MWRHNLVAGTKGWIGPGAVVCISDHQSSVWASMRGRLLKCSAEQVRKANAEEFWGAKLIKSMSDDLPGQLQRRGQRGFIDIIPEGPPEPEDDPADVVVIPDVNGARSQARPPTIHEERAQGEGIPGPSATVATYVNPSRGEGTPRPHGPPPPSTDISSPREGHASGSTVSEPESQPMTDSPVVAE